MSDLVKKIIDPSKDSIETISNFSVSDLEKVIIYASDKYYNKEPVISDDIYDILIDFLKIKQPKSKVLKEIGAPVKSKNKVTLDYWLGSMDKVKPPSNQLAIWTKKYKPPYNLSDKLDGISALLTYDFNGSVKMFTRGSAEEGLDITPLIKYLDLPTFDSVNSYCKKHKIEGDKNLIAFRGELIIKQKTFEKNWAKVLKNPRNSIAGLVNSKKINPELAKDTELILYEVVDPFDKIDKQFKIIGDIGFKLVTNKTINHELTFDLLSKYLKERRSNSEYEVDGIIVTSSSNRVRNTDGNPDYAFAYKTVLEDQIAKTKIISIEWNVSKDGFINPTLILEPVNIGGVTISRATANNARFVVENVLGPGAEIEIIRSGDVIPKVQRVIKPAKSGEAYLPSGDWHWNETQVDIKINDMKSNSQVLIKNIYHFFSSLETKGLGEKNVEKLIDAGLDSVPKILNADVQRFLMVDGFGEKTAQNLVESISRSVTNIPLSRLMAASNKLGVGIGEERIKQVLVVYPNLLTDYKEWSKKEFIDKLKEIDGWEDKTASLLVSNFGEFIKFYNSIKKYIKIQDSKKKVIKGEFTNKTVVLSSFRDKEIQEKIESQGGKVGSSVSKNTDYLIVKDQSVLDNPTDKVKKAQELQIKILTKDKILKMLS